MGTSLLIFPEALTSKGSLLQELLAIIWQKSKKHTGQVVVSVSSKIGSVTAFQGLQEVFPEPSDAFKFRWLLIFCALIVLDKMRSQINARGAKTIRGLGRVFRNFDSFDGNKKIDSQEFFSGLREIQINVTQAEADVRIQIWALTYNLGTHGTTGHQQRRTHRRDWVPRCHPCK